MLLGVKVGQALFRMLKTLHTHTGVFTCHGWLDSKLSGAVVGMDWFHSGHFDLTQHFVFVTVTVTQHALQHSPLHEMQQQVIEVAIII